MLLTALTVLVLAAWYVFVTSRAKGLPSTRVVIAATGASAQIVLVCMVLGAGFLTAGAVSAVSLVIAALLAGYALRSARRRRRFLTAARADLRSIAPAVREAAGWETVVLAAFLLFAGAWLAIAVVHYPPRGVDDLVYHLPPVYQAVQDHRFEILPLELRKFFAFPFNGEMPFLWVTLLTHSTRWVDGTQLAFAILGFGAVFALGRALGLRHRGAFLAAALFGVMPVVLLQATSNYVDVIVNAWVLAAAVALLEFERSGSRPALLAGGLATGLVLGSKYQEVLFVALLAALAVVAILRRGRRGRSLARAAALYAIPAAAAGAFWYVRNAILFKNPFYPLPVTLFGTTLFAGDWPQGPSVWSAILKDPLDVFRIAVWDPGLRTFDGGLGFLFWGCALAAWTRLFFLGVRGRGGISPRSSARTGADTGRSRPRSPRWIDRPWTSGSVLVLGLVPVGVFSLLLTPFDDLALTPRYVLAIAGIGFVALAHAIQQAEESRSGAATMLRGASVLSGVLGLVVAAGSNRPPLDLSHAAAETAEVRAQGEARYLHHGLRSLALMAEGWAPLDAMTRDGAGLTVYQATDFKIFWTAPTFGTDLQNRIWNFMEPAAREAVVPEAFFFHEPSHAPLYIGKTITRETVAGDPGYELVASNGDDVTTLYVERRLLDEKGRRERLVTYYRTLRPALIQETAGLADAAGPGGVLLATFPLASALLVHQSDGRLKADLVPLTTKEIQAEGARFRDRAVYTISVPLDGRRGSVVREAEILGRKLALILNEPAGERDADPSSAGPAKGAHAGRSGTADLPVSRRLEPPRRPGLGRRSAS